MAWRVSGKAFVLLFQNPRLSLDDMDVEFVALGTPAQNFTKHFDTRDPATDNDDGRPTLSCGEFVESLSDTHRVIDVSQPHCVLVRAVDAERRSLAPGRDQAGVIRQHVPALGQHRVVVRVDLRDDVLQERMSVSSDAVCAGQHDARSVLHAGQYLVDIRRPFEVGARIDHGHVVIAGQAGCGHEAGKVTADDDNT